MREGSGTNYTKYLEASGLQLIGIDQQNWNWKRDGYGILADVPERRCTGRDFSISYAHRNNTKYQPSQCPDGLDKGVKIKLSGNGILLAELVTFVIEVEAKLGLLCWHNWNYLWADIKITSIMLSAETEIKLKVELLCSNSMIDKSNIYFLK